jgi:shikimate kinase
MAGARVVVLGISGSGKTTLARRLATRADTRVDMNAMLEGPRDRANRRRFPRRLARFERVVRLRSPSEVEEWAARVR